MSSHALARIPRGGLALLAVLAVALAAALAPAATQPQRARYVGLATKAAGSTRTLDVARPGAVGAGDLLLAAIQVRQTGRRISAPAGWRLIRRDRARRGPSSFTQALYYKVAGTQEPSHYEWGFASAAPALAAIVAYHGVDTGSPIASSSGRASRNVRSIHAPSLRQTPARGPSSSGSSVTPAPVRRARRPG